MHAAPVAIVGCGRMGKVRAAACRELGARVVATVDADIRTAAALAAELPGAAPFQSLAEVDLRSVEAVFVCTPPFGRAAIVVPALRAGIPVLMEKPVGAGRHDVEAIRTQLARQAVVTAVGYMNRYRDSVMSARERLAGEDVYGVTCHWVAPPYAKPWWASAATGGGALGDYATHLVDLCRFLVGEIDEVRGAGSPDGSTTVSTLAFRGGACGTLLSSSHGTEKDIGIEIFHRSGVARLVGWTFAPPGKVEAPVEEVFVRETRAFLAAAHGAPGERPLSDFEDAARTQAAIDAIAHSVTGGEPGRPPVAGRRAA